MESMGNKPRGRRSFTPEFEAGIVELCQRGDLSAGQIAKDFDLTRLRCANGSTRPSAIAVTEVMAA